MTIVPSTSQRLHRLAFHLVIILLFLLPFHAFATVVLNYGLGLESIFGKTQILNAWKEIVVMLLSLLLGIKLVCEFLEQKKAKSNSTLHVIKNLVQWDIFDSTIVAYLIFGIVHFILLKTGILGKVNEPLSLSQLILGAKYDDLFLYVFLLIKHFRFTREEAKTMIETVLISGILSLITAFLLYFFIKPQNLTIFGFRNDWSTYHPNEALAFCQKIENQALCRMSGTFAGPNQFGAYLVMILPFLALLFKDRKALFQKNKQRIDRLMNSRIFAIFALLLSLTALVLTFSRAAYLGAMIAFLTLLSFHYDLKKYRRKIFGALIFFITASGIFLYTLNYTRSLILRPGSTNGHFLGALMGIEQIAKYPLGQGLGSSGPASNYFGRPLIPESWYLQVGIELGVIGLAIFIFIMYRIARELIRKKELPLASSFIALACMALVLHTFEDAPMSITLFALAGAGIGAKAES